jgi:hypothetical protein
METPALAPESSSPNAAGRIKSANALAMITISFFTIALLTARTLTGPQEVGYIFVAIVNENLFTGFYRPQCAVEHPPSPNNHLSVRPARMIDPPPNIAHGGTVKCPVAVDLYEVTVTRRLLVSGV